MLTGHLGIIDLQLSLQSGSPIDLTRLGWYGAEQRRLQILPLRVRMTDTR
jgi:hypothetical protein